MAVVNPCASDEEIFNTGSECSDAMLATYTLYLVPLKDRWTSTDIAGVAGYTNFIENRTMLPAAQRWLPIGGTDTEIGDIVEANSADVIETMPNGVQYLVKRGQFARTFKTAKGGLCFAKALFGNNWTKYGFVEVDKQGKALQVNHGTNGTTGVTTYGPVPLANAYAPLPELATFTTVYKNLFFISFDPLYYVQRSVIVKGDRTENIQDIPGLLDVVVSNYSAPVAASNTAPGGGTVTFTAVGADNDTVQISVNSVDISGTVVKTSSETTVTLLAVKVKDAINALTSTNGGITATNVAGALTIVIPASYGSSVNTLLPIVTIVGTIASTNVAFSAGAYGAVTFQVDVKTECAETNLVAEYPGTSDPGLVQAANFLVTREGVGAVTPTVTLVSVSGSPDHVQIVVPSSTTATSDAITIDLNTPVILAGNGVSGYEGKTGVIYP